ncbi:KAP family P-loop NTPase fold protein [Leptospira sp. SA-E8]|uniref:KAP family P-loop NTPase fold protein n=1 Tax=Leptospira sp. SA-E8 TaxID=3422259 RepID=UPI003EBC459B
MWPDRESEIDYLNFGEVAQIAVDTLSSDEMLPVSIGIFGNWGSGKSSLLKLIENRLSAAALPPLIINFDAWLYQGYDDARAALLEVIATELTKLTDKNPGLLAKAISLLAKVKGFRLLGFIAESAALLSGIPTGGLIYRGLKAAGDLSDGMQNKEEYSTAVSVVKEMKDEATGFLKDKEFKSPPQQIEEFRKEYNEILKELGRPLILIIDNIDRCLPSNAINTLEAIRLFLFLPNTAFIIAADEEMIRNSVSKYFSGLNERHQIDYLDKLIQVPIRVPKAGIREIRSYLFLLYALSHKIQKDKFELLRSSIEKSLQQSWKDDPISRKTALGIIGETEDSELGTAFERADRIASILANSSFINGNPRIVKRLLNVIKIRSLIAKRRDMPIDEAIITKIVIFERCAGEQATTDFYRIVDSDNGRPKLLQDLENQTNSELPNNSPKSWSENPATAKFIYDWGKLEPKLSNVDLRAAIYLSRETIPIGAFVIGLSKVGQDVLKILSEVRTISSRVGADSLKKLPKEEEITVMDALISNLKQTSDWRQKPVGFSGACLLAQHSLESGKMLRRYINTIANGPNTPAWLATLLKAENWYSEAI